MILKGCVAIVTDAGFALGRGGAEIMAREGAIPVHRILAKTGRCG
jgi:hypothetical protein